MPFSGKNYPATWARASDRIFGDLIDLIQYVDDIALSTRDDEEYLNATRKLFERITSYNLKIKLPKCEFFQDEI